MCLPFCYILFNNVIMSTFVLFWFDSTLHNTSSHYILLKKIVEPYEDISGKSK